MEKRTHPITILEFVSKYLFLLLIPVLRGLFYLLTTSHDFYNWLCRRLGGPVGGAVYPGSPLICAGGSNFTAMTSRG